MGSVAGPWQRAVRLATGDMELTKSGGLKGGPTGPGPSSTPRGSSPLRLLARVCPLLLALQALAGEARSPAPEGHARNKERAVAAHEADLERHAGNPAMLVLPGLVADREARRVEVRVEQTWLGADSPCEFTVIAETSDHGYEALLISFARPSDVHRALQFIGLEPGEPWNPGVNRFWAKGERVTLSLLASDGQRCRLEQLLADRRTGRTLREEGFVFTGSVTVPAVGDARIRVYASDEYQPKSIVSLFNSAYSVLQVPYVSPKEEVYRNTIVHPGAMRRQGELLSLIIEPAHTDGSRRVKDLALRIRSGSTPPENALGSAARLNSLGFELKDGGVILNARPSLLAVLAEMGRLDRERHDCFLTVTISDDLELGDAQALARILSTIDSERGVRIEPPPAGELYYRAFAPDPGLLDRKARLHHPWEWSLSEKDGQLEGRLARIDSVWKPGSTAPEFESTETRVSSPEELRRALDEEARRTRAAGIRARPPVFLVFAPPTLRYGTLRRLLAPVLPNHPAIHVYLESVSGEAPPESSP